MVHMTKYKGRNYRTIDLLGKYKNDNVWVSMCHTGDSDYMIKYCNGTGIEWYDWVDRNEKPGRTIPIFVGGLFRI